MIQIASTQRSVATLFVGLSTILALSTILPLSGELLGRLMFALWAVAPYASLRITQSSMKSPKEVALVGATALTCDLVMRLGSAFSSSSTRLLDLITIPVTIMLIVMPITMLILRLLSRKHENAERDPGKEQKDPGLRA